VTAAEFYRQLLRARLGFEPDGDRSLVEAVHKAAGHPGWTLRAVSECVERCLLAEQQAAANANQATLIEAWFDDLSQRADSRAPSSFAR